MIGGKMISKTKVDDRDIPTDARAITPSTTPGPSSAKRRPIRLRPEARGSTIGIEIGIANGNGNVDVPKTTETMITTMTTVGAVKIDEGEEAVSSSSRNLLRSTTTPTRPRTSRGRT